MNPLRIYNTLTQSKQVFQPIDPKQVSLYVCGMTVYDACHLGHGRAFVVFDMVVRYLRYLGYTVCFVRNITDIDDKIIDRANAQGVGYQQLTAHFIDAMHADAQALNTLPPTHEPRASDFLPHMIQMITDLIQKGFAYVADHGDVYYATQKFEGYGRLSHQNLMQLQSGVRVQHHKSKHNPLDFTLWKRAKPNEPSWPSPWGPGRPGWHIECSAMSVYHLGQYIDLHGGGLDLQFPHHENEIAQCDAACGHQVVNAWMHMGHVRVNEEKMSKSLKNFLTIQEVLEAYNPEVVRYFLLASHYRSPIHYAKANTEHAKKALTRLYQVLAAYGKNQPDTPFRSGYTDRFQSAMNDDFNTPEALAVLFDLAKKIRTCEPKDQQAHLCSELRDLGGILGLLYQDPEVFLSQDVSHLSIPAVEQLIAQRDVARKKGDWLRSDQLRDQLHAMGIVLKDTPSGTQWTVDDDY